MLLVLGVQLAKNAHTHDFEDIKKNAASANFSKVTHPCPICDYDLSKDNDHNFQSFTTTSYPSLSQVYFIPPAMLVTSIGTPASGRGPPGA